MSYSEKVRYTSPAPTISQRSVRDRIGFVVDANSAADAVTQIIEAERAGIQQIWMTLGGITDTLTVFAAAAARTTQIRLGTAIVPIYPRHPLVMAQQALTIHDIAPGRLRLGVGPSHRFIIENMYGLSLTSPLAYLREYVEVLREALWNGEVNYHGKFFNVNTTISRTAHIPLLISALGTKAFRLAGEISDGVLPWVCPIPYLLDQALPALRAGAEARNRSVPPLAGHVLIALSTDKSAVQAATHKRLQPYTTYPFYANMFAEAGYPVAPDGSGLDSLAETLVISGDEATIANRLKELLASGLDELLLLLAPVADEAREREQLLHLISSL